MEDKRNEVSGRKGISVIVPVYNVERYLDTCLDSLLSQTLGPSEIVIVDDAATDGSLQIAENYAKRDQRVKVVRHDRNRGLAAGRNTGIAAANGEFIAFVDSDDWVAPDYLERLYRTMLTFNADISACGRYYAYETDSCVRLVADDAPKFANKRLSSMEAIRAMNSYASFDMSMWGKIFRRELFDGIEFPEGKNSEDFFVCYRLLWKADGVAYDPRPLYFYRSRIGSISNGACINRDALEASKQQLSFIDNTCPELHDVGVTAIAMVCIDIANGYIRREMSLDTDEIRGFKSFIRENIVSVNRDHDLPGLKRWQIRCFATSTRLYKDLFKKLKPELRASENKEAR